MKQRPNQGVAQPIPEGLAAFFPGACLGTNACVSRTTTQVGLDYLFDLIALMRKFLSTSRLWITDTA